MQQRRSAARSRCTILVLGLALAVSGLWLAPAPSHACGGFFCSATPVDQTAERIIFTVNDDGTITAYIQIRYTGEKDNFAWIIPVPAPPTSMWAFRTWP